MTDNAHPPLPIALSNAMRDIGAVKKGDFNQFHKFAFRGVESVTNAAYPALCKNGIVIIPRVIETRLEDASTSQGKGAREATVTVEYVVVGPAGDMLTACMVGQAMDTGDKSVSKALSIAYKYLLFQLFAIPTEEGGQEDPDGQAHERAPRQQRSGRRPVPDDPQGSGGPREITAGQKKKLSILMRELGIRGDGVGDDLYRAGMQAIYSIDSIKELTFEQARALIASFEVGKVDEEGVQVKTPQEMATAFLSKASEFMDAGESDDA